MAGGASAGRRGAAAAGQREILDREGAVAGEDHRALGGVAKRADVARPVIGLERGEHVGRHLARGLAVFLRIERDIMVDEQGHVLAPLAQRRQLDLDRVEPEQQVLAEQALVAEPVGREVGGGDDPDVDRHRPVGADRDHLALLERGQQLGLEVERQVADLVEEQGAAVRRLEPADRGRRGRR
jgi:hypothetical protein